MPPQEYNDEGLAIAVDALMAASGFTICRVLGEFSAVVAEPIRGRKERRDIFTDRSVATASDYLPRTNKGEERMKSYHTYRTSTP